MTKVFISYSRNYHYAAYKIHELIENKLGKDTVFWDKKLPPTDDWKRYLIEEVSMRDIFVYLLTPESIMSLYCVMEYNSAAKSGKKFLPILLHSGAIALWPDVVSNKQVIDFTQDEGEANLIKMLEDTNRIQKLSENDTINPVLSSLQVATLAETLRELMTKIYLEFAWFEQVKKQNLDNELFNEMKNKVANNIKEYTYQLEFFYYQFRATFSKTPGIQADLDNIYQGHVHIQHIKGYPNGDPNEVREACENMFWVLSRFVWF